MTSDSRCVLALLLMCAAVPSGHAQDSSSAGPPLSSARSVLACARQVAEAAGFRVEPMFEPRKIGFRAFKLSIGSPQEIDFLRIKVTEGRDTVPPHLEIFAETDLARSDVASPRALGGRRLPNSFALSKVEGTIRAKCSPPAQ